MLLTLHMREQLSHHSSVITQRSDTSRLLGASALVHSESTCLQPEQRFDVSALCIEITVYSCVC